MYCTYLCAGYIPQDAFSENTQHLQRALVSFLNRRSQFDPASTVCSRHGWLPVLASLYAVSTTQYARDFCIGQWMSDLYSELERFQKTSEEEGSSNEKLQEEAQSKKKFLRSLLKVKASEATRYVLTYMYLCTVFTYILTVCH